MVAIAARDPYPRTDIMEFGSFELNFYTSIIPSPIDPNSRRIQFTICWFVKNLQKDSNSIDPELQDIIEQLRKEKFDLFNLNIYTDISLKTSYAYLIVDIDYLPPLGYEKTTSILKKIEKDVNILLISLEKRFNKFLIRRATRDFYNDEIGLRY